MTNKYDVGLKIHSGYKKGIFSVVTVIDAVSASILPVWVDFTSLKGLGLVSQSPVRRDRRQPEGACW